MWGIEASFSLPLLPEIASSADGGVPLVVSKPDGDAAKIYAEIADAVQREVRALSSVVLPQCCYMSDSNTIEILCEGGSKQSISPVELRTLCRSPSNQPDAVADDIFPVDMVPMGNYALSVRWSDGHQSLLPYSSFVSGWLPTGRRLDAQNEQTGKSTKVR